jgi:lambda repressor-like predicted transcriptional regulator
MHADIVHAGKNLGIELSALEKAAQLSEDTLDDYRAILKGEP